MKPGKAGWLLIVSLVYIKVRTLGTAEEEHVDCGTDQCEIDRVCIAKNGREPGQNCSICDPWRDRYKYSYKLGDESCGAELRYSCGGKSNFRATWTLSKIGENISIEVEIGNISCSTDKQTWDRSASEVTVVVPYTGCFTAEESNNNNYLIDRTTMKVNLIKRDGQIERNMFYRYEIGCRYKKDATAASDGFKVTEGQDLSTGSVTRDILIATSMDLYQTDDFAIKVTNMTFQEFDPLFVQIKNDKMTTEHKMVVKECYATSSSSSSSSATNSTSYFEKCGSNNDASFEVRSEDIDDLNVFQYKINAFRLSGQSTIFLHCVVRICQTENNDEECEQTCSSSGKVSLVDSSEVSQVTTTVSKEITIVKVDDVTMCDDIICQANATCFDLLPAVCRCDENYVLDFKDNICRKDDVVKIVNLHVEKYFWESYYNETSIDFLKLALEVESQIMERLNDSNIIGVKVIDARPGSIIFELLMIYATNTTYEEAKETFITTFTEEETEANVPGSNNLIARIKKEEIPIITKLDTKTNQNIAEPNNMILYVAVILPLVGIFVLTVGISVILVMRRRQNEKTAA